MEIDYSKHDYNELQSALGSIDKEKYPKNYENLLIALASKKSQMLTGGNQSTQLVYAGFWKRFGAYWLDVIIMLPLAGLAYLIGERTRLYYSFIIIPSMLLGLWYNVYLVKKYGGTPGKLIFKTRIENLDGSKVGYKQAAIRYSLHFAFTVPMAIVLAMTTLAMSNEFYFSLSFMEKGKYLSQNHPFWYRPVNILMNIWIWSEFIVILTNKKRRALHDFLAGTVVVQNNGATAANHKV